MRMIGGLPTSLRALVATPITRRSRALIGVTALAVAAGGLFVSGVLTSPASKTWSFGTQAGYIWQGRVGSVGASWTVPRIIGTSPCGRAGTWIGAEAPGNPSPFIQLGVNETCLEANGKRGVIYDAFWSDVKLHFHPRRCSFSTPVTSWPRASRWQITDGLSPLSTKAPAKRRASPPATKQLQRSTGRSGSRRTSPKLMADRFRTLS